MLRDSVLELKEMADITIMAAAVADYKPVEISEQKIKKEDEHLVIKLEKTKDILKAVGDSKPTDQILVGFALETENGVANAKAKLAKKNLDLIVLNSPNDQNSAFGHDTNKVTIIDVDENCQIFETKSKSEVAKDIFNEILKKYNA